jgi:D-glycero-D-manno-heptose 1,7-bisphosphate phosphatase
MKPAVFLDRDGVLIEDVHLLTREDQIRILPGVVEALRILDDAGFGLVVVSNQPVVARGMSTEQEVADLNSTIQGLLVKSGGPNLAGWYFCPHHPNASLEGYRISCECRKPRPGLLYRAALEQGLDLSSSFMAGDRMTDITAGRLAGCGTILIRSGMHLLPPIQSDLTQDSLMGYDYVCDGLLEAARWILCK